MKNLFLVINKEKIYAYIVSVMTIVVIFFLSSTINSDIEDTKTTASNAVETTQNNQNTQNMQTTQNTINNESVETSGEIGEAISTSTSSNIIDENETQNSSVNTSESTNEY